MAKAILSRDVTVTFREYEVTAKAGTALDLVKGASGTNGDLWAIPPHSCDAGAAGKAGTRSMFDHDSTYYYVWAPVDAVKVL